MIPIIQAVNAWSWDHIEYVIVTIAAFVIVVGSYVGDKWFAFKHNQEQLKWQKEAKKVRQKAVQDFLASERNTLSLRITREQRMTTPYRHKVLNFLFADKLTDIIEDWEVNGMMSREEATNYYRAFARFLGLTDLLPRRTNTLKERLKEKYPNKVVGEVKVIPFPDLINPKPMSRLERLRAMRTINPERSSANG